MYFVGCYNVYFKIGIDLKLALGFHDMMPLTMCCQILSASKMYDVEDL